MLQFLLEVSQKDPRVLSDREQKLPLQNIPPGCDFSTFCCEYHDYKVLIMSQVTEWLTSSSSATSLFFATSPIIASRRDKNLSCRQKFFFFSLFHEQDLQGLHSQSFRCHISLYHSLRLFDLVPGNKTP